MRKSNSIFKFGFLGLILTLLQILPLNNTSFSQTTPEKAAELWNLRQSEIQQLYQEGNLEGALNSCTGISFTGRSSFWFRCIKNHFQYVVTGTNPWRIRST